MNSNRVCYCHKFDIIGLSFLSLGLLAIIFSRPAIADQISAPACESVPGEFLIKLKALPAASGAIAASLEEAADQKLSPLGVTRQRSYQSVPGMFLAKSNEAGDLAQTTSANAMETLKRDPAVEWIVPNCLRQRFVGETYTVSGTVRGIAYQEPAFPRRLIGMSSGPTALFEVSPTGQISTTIFSDEVDTEARLVTRFFPKGLNFFNLGGLSPFASLAALTTAEVRQLGQSGSVDYAHVHFLAKQGGTLDLIDDLNLEQIPNLGVSRTYGISGRGDIDGDGTSDLVVAEYRGYFGGGTKIGIIYGKKPVTAQSLTAVRPSTGIKLIDYNQDGLLDIVSAGDESSSIYGYGSTLEVFLNQGNYRFAPSRSLEVNYRPNSLAITDIDSDGQLDVVTGSLNGFRAHLQRNGILQAASGEPFALPNEFGGPEARFVMTADITGDSLEDLIIVTRNRFLVLAKSGPANYGGAGWAWLSDRVGDSGSNYTISAPEIIDYDGDGNLDLLSVNNNLNTLNVLLNNTPQVATAYQQTPISFTSVPHLSTALSFSPFQSLPLDLDGMMDTEVKLIETVPPHRVYKTRTDHTGDFRITGLPTGNYSVEAMYPGYRIRLAQSSVPREGNTIRVDRSGIRLSLLGRDDLLPAPIDIPAPQRAPNDPGFANQWGLFNAGQTGGQIDVDVDVPEAWAHTQGNPNLVVAVLDDEVDINHPDLAENIFVNPNEIPNNNIDDDRNGYVDDVTGWDFGEDDNNPKSYETHGTHVAGIIAAKANNQRGIAGVSPGVKILPVKVFPDRGFAADADILAGIDYVHRLKSQGINVRVANASLGGPGTCTQPYIESLARLNQVGVLFVAAAGNGGPDGVGDNNDATPTVPANCPGANVISVANLTAQGIFDESSNFGATTVHVAAPGNEILSTYPASYRVGDVVQDDEGYETISGTSMAAPMVAGVSALLFSVDPSLSAARVKELLIQSSKPLPAMQGKVVSGGIVSALKAIELLRNGGGSVGDNETRIWRQASNNRSATIGITVGKAISSKYSKLDIEIQNSKRQILKRLSVVLRAGVARSIKAKLDLRSYQGTRSVKVTITGKNRRTTKLKVIKRLSIRL